MKLPICRSYNLIKSIFQNWWLSEVALRCRLRLAVVRPCCWVPSQVSTVPGFEMMIPLGRSMATETSQVWGVSIVMRVPYFGPWMGGSIFMVSIHPIWIIWGYPKMDGLYGPSLNDKKWGYPYDSGTHYGPVSFRVFAHTRLCKLWSEAQKWCAGIAFTFTLENEELCESEVVPFLSFQRMDWFQGNSTGNQRFSHEIWGFPLNQAIDPKNQKFLLS